MVEHLGLSGLSFGDQGLVQNIEDVLADFLQLGLDLLAVVTDGCNVLVSTLRLLLLLNRRDYTPGSTSSANNVLVGHREKVSLIDGEFSAQLCHMASVFGLWWGGRQSARKGGGMAYLGNLLHVCNHLIVALGLFTEPCEESLAKGGVSMETRLVLEVQE